MRYGIPGIFAILLLVACSETTSPTAVETPDACACAVNDLIAAPDSSLAATCGEQRKKSDFESLYQQCYAAQRSGLDTSQVSIARADSTQGFSLPAPSEGVFQVIAGRSSAGWQATKVTGRHFGSVGVKSGTIGLQGDALTGSLVLDMASLSVGDISGDSQAKLETHLRSEDFFHTSSYPEATFVVTSAVRKNKHQYEVTGDLTVRGVKHPQTANVVVIPAGNKTVSVTGSMAIDRTLYGIEYRSGKFFPEIGDKMINDIFIVTVSLAAQAQ